ncbi:MAG TPA: hypothetical protein VF173_08055 [Thermoanaerobaculia bacterium]|nr:hypothetical protein [Thermoanaerobaculia bacterium]
MSLSARAAQHAESRDHKERGKKQGSRFRGDRNLCDGEGGNGDLQMHGAPAPRKSLTVRVTS